MVCHGGGGAVEAGNSERTGIIQMSERANPRLVLRTVPLEIPNTLPLSLRSSPLIALGRTNNYLSDSLQLFSLLYGPGILAGNVIQVLPPHAGAVNAL